MSAEAYRIRRATLDDLPALRELWAKAHLPLHDLEKRFTEVQIAETPEGKIEGALAMKIERLHGHIHNEAILDPSNTALYEAFWLRLQILGRNHGLFRLWTVSQNPFWTSLGFKTPDEKTLEKVPASFGAKEKLLTMALKEESAEGLTVEQQFEIFSQSQKAETERLLQQAQVFKRVAYTVIILISGAFGIFALMKFLNRRRPPRR